MSFKIPNTFVFEPTRTIEVQHRTSDESFYTRSIYYKEDSKVQFLNTYEQLKIGAEFTNYLSLDHSENYLNLRIPVIISESSEEDTNRFTSDTGEKYVYILTTPFEIYSNSVTKVLLVKLGDTTDKVIDYITSDDDNVHTVNSGRTLYYVPDKIFAEHIGLESEYVANHL